MSFCIVGNLRQRWLLLPFFGLSNRGLDRIAFLLAFQCQPVMHLRDTT